MPEENAPWDTTSPFEPKRVEVKVDLDFPSRETILQAVIDYIPTALRDDIRACTEKYLSQHAPLDGLIARLAEEAFIRWLRQPGADGQTKEDYIILRFNHFMTEAVSGPKTRQDYLVKVLLREFPDLVAKLARAGETRTAQNEIQSAPQNTQPPNPGGFTPPQPQEPTP